MSDQSEKPKLFTILGPTSVGKSKLALELAKKFNCIIVSADSLQIYRHFDIGTSKPSLEERKEVRHCMIDIVDPDQDYNAGLYRKEASAVIYEMFKEKRNIVLVGGTFLYAKVLISGLIEDIPVDKGVRENLDNIRGEKGTAFLHEKLKELDPAAAKSIHVNDYVRIRRALEVYYVTGEKISELQKSHKFQGQDFIVHKVAIINERDLLNVKINSRVDYMIEKGLVDEVKNIRSMGYAENLKPMKAIGYKEINSCLNSEISLEEAVDLIKRNTRRFAKRQMTWLRNEKCMNWYDVSIEKDKVFEECGKFFNI